MKLRIRRAEQKDLDALVGFAGEEAMEAEGIEKGPETLSKGIKAALLDTNKAIYWVLVSEEDQPVGNISALKEWSNWNAGYYWWIQSLFILPEFRGAGLMQSLIDAVKNAAHREGAIDLRLYVHGKNDRAIKAYHKSGFSESVYRIMRMSV